MDDYSAVRAGRGERIFRGRDNGEEQASHIRYIEADEAGRSRQRNRRNKEAREDRDR